MFLAYLWVHSLMISIFKHMIEEYLKLMKSEFDVIKYFCHHDDNLRIDLRHRIKN